MKSYIYVLVPFTKWIANVVVMMLVFSYIFPVPIAPWVDMIIGFTLSTVLVAPFAYLAFKSGLPTPRQLGIFILAWVLITATAETILNFFFYTNVWMFVIRWEFLVQTLLEIAAILVILRVMRRHNAYNVAAPGIDFEEPTQ